MLTTVHFALVVTAVLVVGSVILGVVWRATLQRALLRRTQTIAANTQGVSRRDYDDLAARYAQVVRAVRNSPVVLLVWRKNQNWQVEYVSENVDRFGYTATDILKGKPAFTQLIDPLDLERVLAEAHEFVNSGKSEYCQEYRIRTASGKMCHIEDRTWIEPGSDQLGPRYCSMLEDVTEAHTLKEHRRQADKLESIGRLAGGIAHDFNNQLVGIITYAELLRLNLDRQDQLFDYADQILGAAKRSRDLTSQLLAFARKGKYQSVPVDTHAVIHEIIQLLERSISKQITIRRALFAVPSLIMGDPGQIENALLNIALNARDAMPQGGVLSFSTETIIINERNREAFGPELAQGEYVRIGITDTGIGMNNETAQRIFEPFFTTKPTGTGMGLAAAYGTVQNHSGSIGVESLPGKGSTFTVLLPVAPVEQQLVGKETTGVPLRGTAHILLIDDEEIVRSSVSAMLERLGYTVKACDSGGEAIAWYREWWRDVDVVLLDMVMTGTSGQETFRALRAVHPGVRVIVSSGGALDSDTRKLVDSGVMAFIQKPFIATELVEVINEALEHSVDSVTR